MFLTKLSANKLHHQVAVTFALGIYCAGRKTRGGLSVYTAACLLFLHLYVSCLRPSFTPCYRKTWSAFLSTKLLLVSCWCFYAAISFAVTFTLILLLCRNNWKTVVFFLYCLPSQIAADFWRGNFSLAPANIPLDPISGAQPNAIESYGQMSVGYGRIQNSTCI